MNWQRFNRALSLGMVAVLLAVAMFAIEPQPVSAATVTARPDAAGDETTLTPNTGTNWAAVSEVTSDDDTTYVEGPNGDTYATDLYSVADVTLSGKGDINSVAVYIRARTLLTASQPSAYTRIQTNGTAYDGTAVTLTTAYADYSTAYTTNPATGVSWTWAEVNALQAGVGLRRSTAQGQSSSRISRATQVWVVVDYNPVTSWESYSDAGRTLVNDLFNSGNTTVYMSGGPFARGVTKVGYYDAFNDLVQTDTFASFTGGTLATSQCILNQAWGTPPEGNGTWHAVVLQTSAASLPSTYAAAIADASYVTDDAFYVTQDAIPEFPAVIAAIVVTGVCFAIYYRMRKRGLAYVKA